jgi:alkanesulfonate monooxygenase SsuD/methylene tetrahydromethanopterin reductase-like flavin-dependent oxidoreductase (luciferase family)
VILGGMGPNAIRRVATWGDGWMPIALPPDEVGAARREMDRIARECGRDPRALSISVMIGAPPGLEDPSLDMIPARDVVAAYAAEGADRVVVSLPTLPADDALRHLDRVAAARP